VKERFFLLTAEGAEGTEEERKEKREIRYSLAKLIAILIDLHPR